MSIDPPRFASLPPYAAHVIRAHLAAGARLTGAEVRAHVQWLRQHGYPGLAEQTAAGWAQLDAAAEDHQRRRAAALAGDLGDVDDLEHPDPVSPSRSAAATSTGPGADSGETDTLTTTEAAQMLGCTPRRVAQMLKAGTLPGRRSGRDWQTPRAAVEAMLDDRAVRAVTS